MYVPYLYGRQYELLAIRMILNNERQDRGTLMPLIEPVVAKLRDLNNCLRLCGEEDQPVAVIVNPHKHELSNATDLAQWQKEAWSLIDELPHVVPTLHCDEGTARKDIEQFLGRFIGRRVAIVYFGISLDNRDQKWLSTNSNIRWHMVLSDHVSSSFWEILPRDRLILIKDCFKRRVRNADYDGREFFTDRHKTYQKQAAGIGDYLCLGRLFQSGGSTPAAVAIHAIFKETNSGDVWVEHFVSDDRTLEEGDVASKFVQAARKLTTAARRRQNEFGLNPVLTEYARLAKAAEFPGLPTNKKLQMVHHICLMIDVIAGRL